MGNGIMEKGNPSREQFFFSGRTVDLCKKWKVFLIGRKFETDNWEMITLSMEVGCEEEPIFPLGRVQFSSFPVLFHQDQDE
jgi:hypothetical protein